MVRTQAVACLSVLALLAGCSRERAIRVGSKNFTEQAVLGEIIARQLERKLRARVDRRLDMGGTLLAHSALVAGEIDVYPEYSGTALTAILKLPLASDAAQVRERVREEYRRRGLVWFPPLGFDDTFAMVVRAGEARAQNIETLSDAARARTAWRLGVGYEFLTRPDGYPALMKTYRLPVEGSPKTMDLGLLYRALDENQVSMVAGNSTDGRLAGPGLKVLRDDRGAFPPYEASVVARQAALAAHPGMREALEALSGRITEQAMRKMNGEVDGEHRRPGDVAREFLAGLR